MGSAIVYFEIAGPDAARLVPFFKDVFGWEIDDSAAIASHSTGGLRGGIRQDPPDKVLYIGVEDIETVLARIEAHGGIVVLPRTVVPGVVTFALFKDPAGNLLGITETGPSPDSRLSALQGAIPVLHVKSAAAALDFYCDQLGFRLDFRVPADAVAPNPCYMGLVRGNAVLHLSSHAGDGIAGGVVYVLVDDVDGLHAEFRRRGVRIHLAPTDQIWGMREMYVRDPDGNSVRFGSRTEPSATPTAEPT